MSDFSWIDRLPFNLVIEEVAKICRCSTKTIRRKIDLGLLKAVRLRHGGSSRVLIPRSEIERLFSNE